MVYVKMKDSDQTVHLHRLIRAFHFHIYHLSILANLRPDFMSNLVCLLAFGISKFYIAPYGKINHGLVNLSYNRDVKSGLRRKK